MTGKLSDFLFLFRFPLLIAHLALLFVGYYIGRGPNTLSSTKLIMVFSYFLALIAVNIINELFDTKSDSLNKTKDFILHTGKIKKRNIIILLCLIIFSSLLISFLTSFQLFVLCIIALILSFLYTNPFLSFKSIPPLDIIINISGCALLCITVGYHIAGGDILKIIPLSLPYLFLIGGLYLATTVPDIPSDRKAKVITTGVLFGKKKTLIMGTFFIVLSVIFSKEILTFVINSITLLVFIFAIIKPSQKSIRRTFIIPTALYTFAMGALYWQFLIFIILSLLFLNYYYKKNFNKSYP